jgi:prepilin-type N-terminal cleavage/methylation domain-containing protein
MENMSAIQLQPTTLLARPQHERPRTARGFTLIEIMLVVVVIGVLSSFALPYFQKATARARRAEMQVVLEKLHVYFINQYENSSTFCPPGCIAGTASATSSWNPDNTVIATGQPAQWDNKRTGWQQIPFAFDGGMKMRYQYVVVSDPSGATPGSMTITVEGDMPGLGPKISGHTGNYLYTETLSGPIIDQTKTTELPSAF